MNQSTLIGWTAAALAVMVGASWQVATRAASGGSTDASAHLAAMDLLALRYTTPALLLIPVLCKLGFWPRQVPTRRLLVLLAFGGLFYGFLAVNGARFAPAAHMGALIPGTIPLFVAALAWLVFGERVNWRGALGLGMLFTGVAMVATGGKWAAAGQSAWIGDTMFLLAALNWSVYTTAMRGVTLSPIHVSALVSFWNMPVALLLWWWLPGSAMATAPLATIAFQALVQGVIGGILGNVLFLIVVQRLGAQAAAGAGAAVPAVTAIGAWLALGEGLSAQAIAGIGITMVGIWVVQVLAKR